MKNKSLVLRLVFLLIFLLVLAGTFTENIWLNYPIKPLIMIWLGIIYLLETKPDPNRKLVLTAFLFSWIGDVLLMLVSANELLFYAGVGGFFLSQVSYIVVFCKIGQQKGKGFLRKYPIWGVLFLAYFFGMYGYLLPNLQGIMKPIVAVYAISLLGMSAAALNLKGNSGGGYWQIIFFGSVFFVLSDTILAINKFSHPIENGGFWILSTYMVAQYLILEGLIRMNRMKV